DYAKAYFNLAWIQATCPNARYRDGKNAIVNAGKANQLNGGKDLAYIFTLAAAYAEDGRFDRALEWQTKAIELAPENHKERLRSRLELYKLGKPYRQEPKKP
ncbi:MAG: tetratricopeptide repeat protein, partial [Planctomycetota bacterium]|nr:tetratricopeptide repeat protein [Planctomycetota bacterium]